MSRIYFANLLKKYLSGNATDSERETVEQWYGMLEEEPRPLSVEQWDELENRLWLKVSREERAKTYNRVPVQRLLPGGRFFRVAVAASVAFLLAVGFLIYRYNSEQDSFSVYKEIEGMQVIINSEPLEKAVALEDGSLVKLKSGSELCIPTHFESGKREVFLKGEAFF